MVIALALASGFSLALLAPWVVRLVRNPGWLLAVLPLALTVYFASRLAAIERGDYLSASYEWVPALGVRVSFWLDGLSLLFALLICGIGTLVVVYAGAYLAGHDGLGRFYAYLFLFFGSMLGLVLADNVITLFVFWELTSISSFFLIGFNNESESARKAALQALYVTAGGGLALLAGFVLLAEVGGSSELSVLREQGDVLRESSLYLPALLLVLAGAFTKSAQFPFHFWLPNAMEAPTPVSAYLHSATMVKAGVYLLARLNPALGDTDAWFYLLTTFGAATMLLGAWLAVQSNDLKRILAYSTVSSLGMLVLLLGLGSTLAIKACIVLLLAHALYKGALFLVAGAIDHETGTREISRLGGLRQAMPLTAGVALMAAASMAGLPPLYGFLSKETMYEATLAGAAETALVTGLAVAANALIFCSAGLVAVRPFFGALRETPRHAHEPGSALLLGPFLLAALGLLIGALPNLGSKALLAPAASNVAGEAVSVQLLLWHGFNLPLLLSAVTVSVGAVLYGYRSWLTGAAARLLPLSAWTPGSAYDAALLGLNRVATTQTRLLQNGYLRLYVAAVVATAAALGAFAWIDAGGLRLDRQPDSLRFYEAVIAGAIVVGAFTAIKSTSRLATVAALGAVGYGVALIYLLFGAPDLAMTQVVVETLTVVLLVLAFYSLPRFSSLSSRVARARDAGLALLAGGCVTVLLLAVSSVQSDRPASEFFATASKPLAHGSNVVNVILVDFRALDTLGEITVLAVAGIGAFALLKLRTGKEGSP